MVMTTRSKHEKKKAEEEKTKKEAEEKKEKQEDHKPKDGKDKQNQKRKKEMKDGNDKKKKKKEPERDYAQQLPKLKEEVIKMEAELVLHRIYLSHYKDVDLESKKPACDEEELESIVMRGKLLGAMNTNFEQRLNKLCEED